MHTPITLSVPDRLTASSALHWKPAKHEAVKKAISYPNLKLRGLHCHIGSQILDTQGFTAAAEVTMEFIEKLKKELGYEAEDLNLGGGFGIRYTEADDPLPYDGIYGSGSKGHQRFLCIARCKASVYPDRTRPFHCSSGRHYPDTP